jgi:hypothetical protein
MKTKLAIVIGLVFIIAGSRCAFSEGEIKVPPAKPAPKVEPKDEYYMGKFSISPFTGLNLSKTDELHGRQFTGLGVAYELTKTVSITGEAAATDLNERFVDQYGGHLKAYLPIGKTGLLGYGEIGYQRFTTASRDFMSVGAGFEIRATKYFGGFVGARWLNDFHEVGEGQILLGGSLRF